MIRHAKPSEIEQILSITKACAAKMTSQNIHQWNQFYPSKQAFHKDIERNELYVLILENRIIGCMVISSEKDIEYDAIDWLTKDGNNYYIHRLAVHPKHQGAGNARKLMDYAEGFARKNHKDSIRLDTFSRNIRNQQFYEARGYKRLGNIYFPKQSEHPFYCYELVF